MYNRITLKTKDIELMLEHLKQDSKDLSHIKLHLKDDRILEIEYEDKNSQECVVTLRSIAAYMGPQIKKMMPLKVK